MWCEKCNIETEYTNCPECHSKTVPVPESGVYWCVECKIPIMKEPRNRGEEQSDMMCTICGRPTEYLASDMRPVFPEERLLVELLLNKKPYTYMNASVWAANNRYYIDGKSVSVSSKHYQNADTGKLGEQLKEYGPANSYEAFNAYIDLFVRANSIRLQYAANEILRDFYPEEYGERKILSYPIGQFVSTLNRMWDEDLHDIVLDEELLIECFATGWLATNGLSGNCF